MTNRYGLHQRSGNQLLGSSLVPFNTLNLGMRVGDGPENVERNRRDLAQLLSVDEICFMDQVHGCEFEVIENTEKNRSSRAARSESQVDALILKARTPGDTAIAVQVADCAPLALISDQSLAVIHVGRKGLVQGIVERVIGAHFSQSQGVAAVLGPSICSRCYPLSPEIYDEIVGRYPRASGSAERHEIDLAAGIISILEEKGITWEWFGGEQECVSCDRNYFSYRRDGITGRQALVLAW
jgi:YfiH family protein